MIPYSLSLDAPQPMSFISIWFQGSIVPHLSFPIVIVDFIPTIGADDLSKFFYCRDGWSSIPFQVKPAEIIQRNFIETVGIGEAAVISGVGALHQIRGTRRNRTFRTYPR